MFPHVGSGNHGCEAIVRSTDILFSNHNSILFSNHPEEDRKYITQPGIQIYKDNKEVERFSSQYFKAIFQKYLLGKKDAFDRATFFPVLSRCQKNKVLLSIGGDLYCYDPPEYIYRVNKYIREQGCKTVLWGCSVEPSYIDSRMREDLKKYDLICARESITYEALKSINSNTILTVDPAFILPALETKLPAKSYIGINVSPLIIQRETVEGIILKNYAKLIEYILENTDESIALIPHVVWKSNDDRNVLLLLKKSFPNNNRVIVVADHNCMEQKYIISHCRMFIGARTHATIAAYSSCVPTLVVGYSVKARGIARDIFGDSEHYVLPINEIKKSDDLIKAFNWLWQNEENIRRYISDVMPEYINKVYKAVDAVESLGI